MAENLDASDVRLTDDQMRTLDGITDVVQGDRNISDDPRWISLGRE